MTIFLKRLASLLAMLAAGHIGITPALAQAPSPIPIKFRMDWVPSGIYAAFYYAKQRGYYTRAGFDAEIIPGNGSNATMDALVRGDIDFGFASCWGLAVGIGKGRDVVSVATFTGRNGFSFIFPAKSNIETLADLKGKTIVVSPASLDTLLFPSVLTKAGLPADLMRRVSVEPAQKVPTYVRGQADVVVSHIPYAEPLIQSQRPSRYILWASTGFVLPDFCIATSRERLKKDPAMIERFLRATFEATKAAQEHPADAAAAGVELNPILDPAVTERQWRLMTEFFFTDSTKACPHGWHSPEDWAKGLAVLKEDAGLEGDIADQSRFYTNQFFACSPSK